VLVSPASQARLNGIVRLARERGWVLTLESDLSHPPRGWRGDGVISTLKDTSAFRSFVATLRKNSIPIVNAAGRGMDMGVPTVCGDDGQIGALAAGHFAERRFQNVAWFSSKWGLVQRTRYDALAREWAALGRSSERPPKFVWSERPKNLKKEDWQSFVAWLGDKIEATPKPLGIFAYSDYDAARVASACREHGLDVPGEVAVLGVDNNPIICENQVVPISSVNHDLEKIGYKAAELLDRLMNGGRKPVAPLFVKPRGITVRRSTDTVAVGNPVLRAAMTFISENIANPIGAPQIAAGIGISRLKLDRMFAKELGISVGREIAHQRFAKAKLLLAGTKMTLAEIARETGFCNAAYLANVFKRETGLRPAKYRAQVKSGH